MHPIIVNRYYLSFDIKLWLFNICYYALWINERTDSFNFFSSSFFHLKTCNNLKVRKRSRTTNVINQQWIFAVSAWVSFSILCLTFNMVTQTGIIRLPFFTTSQGSINLTSINLEICTVVGKGKKSSWRGMIHWVDFCHLFFPRETPFFTYFSHPMYKPFLKESLM